MRYGDGTEIKIGPRELRLPNRSPCAQYFCNKNPSFARFYRFSRLWNQ
jgi:hypothetical protein